MTQIIVDTVHPDILDFVRDDVFDVEQVQNARRWYLLQPLPQAAIGRGLGQEQALQFDVALEGEHPAVVAVYAGDLVDEGQVGSHDFLQLSGHYIIINGLRRQLLPKNLPYLAQVAGVPGQT